MWLNEHEDLLAELQPDDDDILIFTASEGRCMARVLRELEPRARAYLWIIKNMPSPVLDTISDRLEAIGLLDEMEAKPLSDDAKELLR